LQAAYDGAVRALAITCLLAHSAFADVVVVETRGAPALPSLASQITLHAGTQVTTRAEPDADPLTFGERAAQLAAGGDTKLVVWIAPVDGGYLVFVTGRATGRALTELVRIDANIGTAEIERTIALKIAGLLDAVLDAPTPIAAVLDVPVPAQTELPPPKLRRWRIEVGGSVTYERHERAFDGRAALAGGRAVRIGSLTLVPMLGGYWQPSGTIERAAGRASIVELGGVAGVEAGKRLGPIELFARPRFVAAGLSARGVSDDGRRGRATVFAPYVGVEVGVGRAIANVRFAAIVGYDFALIRRELVIDDETIVDLGAMRFHVGLAMTVSL
jgi:hypothetical protein